jgi:outer membrane protein
MKHLFTFLILLELFAFIPPALSQDTVLFLTLDQTRQLAIRNNVNVKNAELETLKARYKVAEVQSNRYPKIEGYSSFSNYFAIPKMIVPGEIFGQTGLIPLQIGTTYDWASGFKATLVLFNMSYFTSVKIAKQMEELGNLTIDQKKEEIVYQVSQLYYLCKTTQKQISLLNQSLENGRQMAEIAKLQSENGIIRKVDHSRVLVDISNLQNQVDNLTQLYNQQTELLKYISGIKPECRISLSDSIDFTTDVTIVKQSNLSERSEIRLLDKQMTITELSAKSNRQAYLPSLYGFGEYYFHGQRNEFDFFKAGEDKFFKVGYFGVSLSIPVFDGVEKRSKSRQLDIDLQQLRNSKNNALEYFSKEYLDAAGQLQNNLTILSRQGENLKVAEEIYETSLLGYRQGVVSLTDLLITENALTEARLSYSNTILQLRNSELDLSKANGTLLK